ncbi:MAG: Hint domain-containing protein, partial [Paracoccaceae bacterium]
PLFPDKYTFDYIGEDGITYSGTVRAKDAGEDDFTTDPPPIIICYAPGTMIDTPDGPRAIETLRPGDMVNTLDNDAQEILWVHHDDQPLEAVERDAKPILIAAGALGKGRPAQDLIVSPQHRMLAGGGGQLRGQFNTEAFAPAKSLTSLPGIRPMMGKPQITWFHFACKAHEVVFANGCFSESLLLGPIVLNGLTGTELLALTDIFGSAPTPDAALNGPPARNCLKVGAVRRQLKENDKEKRHHRAKENRNWDVDLAMEQYETERLREAKATNQLREHLLGFA